MAPTGIMFLFRPTSMCVTLTFTGLFVTSNKKMVATRTNGDWLAWRVVARSPPSLYTASTTHLGSIAPHSD